MTLPRRTLAQGLLATLSLLGAIAVCEVALRLFHPKYANVAETHHYHTDVSRIWWPKPNSTHVVTHPDSRASIPVFYNGFGLRQSREFGAETLRNATNVAFFGDSYTENRRIRSAHSFTESLDFFLNLRERVAFNVLKFGVAGYGPGQQFIWYRQFEHRDELDYVVYVFCANDIRDFHRHGLFSLDEDGGLVVNAAHRTSFLTYLLSRLHLTYLVLETAQHMELLSATFILDWHSAPMDAAGRAPAPLLSLADIKRRAERRRQEGDAFSGDAVDDSIAAFQTLLLNWKQEVETHGGKFYAAVPPDVTKESVQETIPAAIDIVALQGCFREAIPNYSYDAVRFENDPHWSEAGNMVVAHCLHRFLEQEAGLPPLSDDLLAEARYEFYWSVGLGGGGSEEGGSEEGGRGEGWMPSSAWATRPAKMRHDPEAIRARYLALERPL